MNALEKYNGNHMLQETELVYDDCGVCHDTKEIPVYPNELLDYLNEYKNDEDKIIETLDYYDATKKVINGRWVGYVACPKCGGEE